MPSVRAKIREQTPHQLSVVRLAEDFFFLHAVGSLQLIKRFFQELFPVEFRINAAKGH
jgi:hypothetical protein